MALDAATEAVVLTALTIHTIAIPIFILSAYTKVKATKPTYERTQRHDVIVCQSVSEIDFKIICKMVDIRSKSLK